MAITLAGVTQQAMIGPGGTFATTFATVRLAASGVPYTVIYGYPGDGGDAAASASSTLTVARATPVVGVSDPGGDYSGSAFPATAGVTGLGGSAAPELQGVTPSLSYYSGTSTTVAQLAGLTPLPAAPSAAGSYTVLASFAGSADYTAGSALADFTITAATATVGRAP